MGSTIRKISDLLNNKGFVRGTNRYIGGHVTSRGGLSRAREQEKSKVNQDSQILDESLENFKKPNSDLDVAQKIAKTA